MVPGAAAKPAEWGGYPGTTTQIDAGMDSTVEKRVTKRRLALRASADCGTRATFAATAPLRQELEKLFDDGANVTEALEAVRRRHRGGRATVRRVRRAWELARAAKVAQATARALDTMPELPFGPTTPRVSARKERFRKREWRGAPGET